MNNFVGFSKCKFRLKFPGICQLLSLQIKYSTSNYEVFTDNASIYVHWPYCAKRCTYCNFNKYINSNVDNIRMTDSLVTETKALLKLSGVKQITSIFFGGGTPSLAPPSTIQRIIECVKQVANLSNRAEITLEANPTALEFQKLRDFKAAGINRLSVGVQSLNDAQLRILGRNHTAAESIRCVEEAINLYKGKVSIDLIFGIPGQTLKDWSEELKRTLCFCDDHLSLYQLIVKRGTPLYHKRSKGIMKFPNDDILADMYEETVKILEEEKFSRYEVSNFARNGAESIHNKSYWQGKQYIGVGPGAHGRFVTKGENLEGGHNFRQARIQILEPGQWMAAVERFGHGTKISVPLSLKDILEEGLVMTLRTDEGIDCSEWHQRTGVDLLKILFSSETIQEYMLQKFFSIKGNRLKATKKGILVLDRLLPDFILALQQLL
ncbi:radical S-adenosyl methionine domain-containing protein 1, mitochondrial [Octopus bimaculoides]|uniref:Radical S-adenosyl methionine domain-containing protein 1, mitochondrial n=1 Tax=Octopus bimaculoides TaxID=37653 RepID=A0A0L8G3J4_OCTBM|nr:radical S-adenosyl methionine domain-containing protein 1, mitochondrial [Octopus bimaculoides]|eukprot:XP_014784514.1 PREDICTED: radical S-adenosyl methionine domain-containing protein 1, mitochondrial-like [Octopus bimaculoides]